MILQSIEYVSVWPARPIIVVVVLLHFHFTSSVATSHTQRLTEKQKQLNQIKCNKNIKTIYNSIDNNNHKGHQKRIILKGPKDVARQASFGWVSQRSLPPVKPLPPWGHREGLPQQLLKAPQQKVERDHCSTNAMLLNHIGLYR